MNTFVITATACKCQKVGFLIGSNAVNLIMSLMNCYLMDNYNPYLKS